jgi:hypothetical protein
MGLDANWIASPAGKLPITDTLSPDGGCGPCSGSAYRGISSPESFNTAYIDVSVAGSGVATLAGFDYTLFNNNQGLSTGNTTTSFGALSGVPTEQETNMWGGALDITNRRYVLVGMRASIGKPFIAADLNATHAIPALTDGDLSALRAIVAECTGLYVQKGSQDCEHPMGVIDAFRIGPEDDPTAGNRASQPVYLSDPLAFIASENGRSENCIVRVKNSRASSVQLPAYATASTLRVPLRIWLTIVRPAANAMGNGGPCPVPATAGMRR